MAKRGRPPTGKALTSAERQRRYLDRIRATGVAAMEAQVAALKDENATLRRRIAFLERHGEGQDQLKITRTSPQEFGETGRLRAENAKLKADIRKLKAMMQEEPEATKLRKRIVELRAEMATLRRALKEIAKERDNYRRRTKPEHREAQRLLTSSSYRTLIKALHSDRTKHVSSAELVEAERLCVALRPLFIEEERSDASR
jgi:hypothetical protein